MTTEIQSEVIIEQIMSYSIAAGEIVQADFPEGLKKTYTSALVPFGPDFYTGMLKAIGYMLLDKTKNKVVFFYQQTDSPKNVLINFLGKPVFGKVFSSSFTFKKTKPSSVKDIPVDVYHHIRFIRVLMQINDIIVLGVGNKVSEKTIVEICNQAKKEGMNMIFATNLSQTTPYQQGKESDENLIKNITLGKSEDINEQDSISKYFAARIAGQKSDPEVITYINTGDFGGNLKTCNGYVTIVA